MDAKKYIGIYLGKTDAVIAAVNLHAQGLSITKQLRVTLENTEQDANSIETIVELIAQTCRSESLSLQDGVVALTLDNSYFMQHGVHSEFTEHKQIAQTIHFDTEENVAVDIATLALAFTINRTDQTGSDVTVYTIQKNKLDNIIRAFQKYSIDPVTIQPDIRSLDKLVQLWPSEFKQDNAFVFISDTNGYIIIPSGDADDQRGLTRAFLTSPKQNKIDVLKRQLKLTAALLNEKQTFNNISLLDDSGSIDLEKFSGAVGKKVTRLGTGQSAENGVMGFIEQGSKTDIAVAASATVAFAEKDNVVDFRADYRPYQGRKLKIQRMIQVLSVCVFICILIVGALLQRKLTKAYQPLKDSRVEFNSEYLELMGKKSPASLKEARTKLKNEVKRLEKLKKGVFFTEDGPRTPAVKLALLLKALNSYAMDKSVSINIKSITVGKTGIKIIGDTNSNDATVKLIATLEANNIAKKSGTSSNDKNRNIFNFTLEVK